MPHPGRTGAQGPRPVDLCASPSDRPAPCGPWGRPVDNAVALPTARPHSRASRTQVHRTRQTCVYWKREDRSRFTAGHPKLRLLPTRNSKEAKFYNDAGEGLPFHQGVSNYGFRFVSHRVYSSAVTKIAEPGDILVSVRAPVGRINVTRDKIVLGRGLAAIRSRTEYQSFLFYALKNHFYTENIIGTGAIYAATNKKELEGQVFLKPPATLLQEFEIQARVIDQQIACLTNQNDSLTLARDSLLPRLMNGKIAV